MAGENKDKDGKKKFFITAAFPYPNSPQHIGHARTYSMTDIYARFKKHKGFDVLFPMAFHVTGTPIIGMAERIKEHDKDTIEVLTKIYGVPEQKLKELTDPEKLVLYFANEIEQGMKEMHFMIDWSRKFYTFDKHFQKFIQWQFLKLKKLGLLLKAEHPVAWSIKLNSAVGAHDTKGDIDPEIEEVCAIKFRFRDGYLIATTYRPETIFGVTNIWVNAEADYVKIKDRENNEIYYISKGTLQNFSMQKDVEAIEEIKGAELLNSTAYNPADKKEVPIYHARFVKPNNGTGLVMSVPAHAPFDYIALKDIGKLEIKKIIEVEGYDIPAKDVVEKMGIKNQDDERLEQATKKVYKDENAKGMLIVWQRMPVSKAKDEVKKWLIENNNAFSYYIIANGPIKTRAGDEVVVKLVKDQWFIDYGNKEWKEKALKCLDKMVIIPNSVKQELRNTILWLDKKACTRARGLGTQFPFDESQVIESLSDSTIYPAFYTIADKIKAFSPQELDEAFFDYVFYGKGKPKNEMHEKLREQFLYWYPVDSRHSGPDLIRNHLAFYIMNHVAIFPEQHWPKQIAINGFVMMEGKKMSKSMGNILPLRQAIKEHGADIIRFSVVSSADLLQDTDFNKTLIEGIKQRLSFFNYIINKSSNEGNTIAEQWIRACFNEKLGLVDKLIDNLDFREFAKLFFYDFYNELKWYESIVEKPALKETIKKWLIVIEPFFPDFAMQNGANVNMEIPKQEPYDEHIIASMSVVRETYGDIANYMLRKGIKHANIKIIIPHEWKYRFFEELKLAKGNVRNIYNSPYFSPYKNDINDIVKRLGGKIFSIPSIPKKELFKQSIKASIKNFQQFGNITIIDEENIKKEEITQKEKSGLPLKPCFIIE